MRDLSDRSLDTAAQLGASYADVRVVLRHDESIAVKSGRVEGVAAGESEGFGVRVLVDGGWGFASSSVLTAAEADRVAAEAVRIAKASATALRDRVRLDDRPPAHGTYETPIEEDPFGVPLEEKIGHLLAADEAARSVDGVAFTEARYDALRETKTFAATDGSWTEQTGDPRRLRHRGQRDRGRRASAAELPGRRRRDLPRRGLRVRPRARPGQPRRRPGRGGGRPAERGAVPGGPLHGHPRPDPALHAGARELRPPDRAGPRVRTEASYAGTSFLTTDKLDEAFRYGSDLITIVADATSPGGLGTFGWDDEGVAAQAVPLVQDGIFVGYLSSRETAPRIGRQSGGAMRADGWNRIPLIRMTNVNLLPRPGMSLDDIVADTDDGLYLASNRSWSIDDRRLNFQFATEIAWEIKGGKKGRMFRNPTYTGITYELWRSCDAVGDDSSWVMLGTPNCGKGEPGQGAHVGHGCSGARFRDVQVGVGKW
jgi:TldD protein